jgi:rubrerythrin
MLENIGKEDMDKDILRTGVIAEFDAINLYEQMAAMTKNSNVKKVLLDVAKE